MLTRNVSRTRVDEQLKPHTRHQEQGRKSKMVDLVLAMRVPEATTTTKQRDKPISTIVEAEEAIEEVWCRII
jgi:hypothetical protein